MKPSTLCKVNAIKTLSRIILHESEFHKQQLDFFE